jgi:hypothetical protein
MKTEFSNNDFSAHEDALERQHQRWDENREYWGDTSMIGRQFTDHYDKSDFEEDQKCWY